MKTVTDYSINKYNKDAIVYVDANGNETRLTVNDFESEEEFRLWKEWSDNNLHEIEKGDHVEASHCISAEDVIGALFQSAEDELLREEAEEEFDELLKRICDVLTPIQCDRLLIYLEGGLNEEQIGVTEEVSHQAISKSVQQSINRIRSKQKKIFSGNNCL